MVGLMNAVMRKNIYAIPQYYDSGKLIHRLQIITQTNVKYNAEK